MDEDLQRTPQGPLSAYRSASDLRLSLVMLVLLAVVVAVIFGVSTAG